MTDDGIDKEIADGVRTAHDVPSKVDPPLYLLYIVGVRYPYSIITMVILVDERHNSHFSEVKGQSGWLLVNHNNIIVLTTTSAAYE